VNALPARADTVRIVEWEELPPSVREIRADFNPLAEGVLMRHQAEWVAIRARLKVAVKGRRTGITFAEALDDTIIAGSARAAGGDNVYYVADKREKGLEFVGYCARLARVIAQAQGQGVSAIEEYLFEDQDERGNSKHITAWRIRFASGFQAAALSSRPANIRGLQGIVVIDEAAFHLDVQAVLDAATALLIWGGAIRVISTHNGKKNPFNQLVRDIENGLYGADARVFTVTFDDAVANGLYERVCLVKGWTPRPEAKAAWYQGIRAAYGPRRAAMREELDAVPRDGGGVCIPGVWIERAMREERPVLRLTLDDDFAALPERERIDWAKDWIARELAPVLERLPADLEHVFGMDYARHRNFSVIAPVTIGATLRRIVPFLVELQNVPTRQQEHILWALVAGLPKWRGGAIDATGAGAVLAEYTADKFGANRVHQVVLNRAWYQLWMPKFVQTFEDATIDLPRDANVEQDLRAIDDVDGIPMVPAVERADLKDPELFRHGDAAIALALAHYASLNKSAPIEYESAGVERESRQLADYLME
jgi:phage FluMu gp28-like protein